MSCHVPVVSYFSSGLRLSYHLKVMVMFTMTCMNFSHCTVPNFHLILLNWLLVLSQLRLIDTQNLTYFVQKTHLVLSQIFTWFCQIGVFYCPNFDIYIPKIHLNLSNNLSRFRFDIKYPFRNNHLVLPLNFDSSCH